jgi:hypothetical protein
MIAWCASALGCLSYVALRRAQASGASVGTPPRAYAIAAGVLFAASAWAFSGLEHGFGAVLLAVLAWTAAGSLFPLAALGRAPRAPSTPTPRPSEEIGPQGRRGRSVARALVSILGTLPAAWLLAAAVARLLPIEASLRLSIGFMLTLPLWVIGMCIALLDHRVWRAALASMSVTASTYGVLQALG